MTFDEFERLINYVCLLSDKKDRDKLLRTVFNCLTKNNDDR